MPDDTEEQQDGATDSPQPGPDEVFCADCGAVIKKQAEICTECGVRQQPEEGSLSQQSPQEPPQNAQPGSASADLSQRRQYELEKIASNDKATIALIGILISPVAYWMIGKKTLAIVNFLTFNFFLLGPIIVPIHCYSMINDAENELHMSGVGGY